MKTISRYIMTLALLITAATGAWADETPLVTINASSDFTSGSKTFDNKVTATFSDQVSFSAYGGGWISTDPDNKTLTVEPADGVTITRVKYYTTLGNAEVATAPFQASMNLTYVDVPGIGSQQRYHVSVKGIMIGAEDTSNYLQKIEVYGTAEPPIEVTTNAAEAGATFTEATFAMPAYDATADYELVRDMTYQVNAYVGTTPDADYRHRVEKVDENLYKPVDITTDAQLIALFPVIDVIDAQNPKTLTYGTDYTLAIVDEQENEIEPTEFDFAPGTYTVKVTGKGDYDGVIDSQNAFKLYLGVDITVPAGELVTYYSDETLYTEEEDAEIYTITDVSGTEATATELTIVPANTPFLVKNTADERKTFLFIVTDGDQLPAVNYYPGFTGTLNATTIDASTADQTNYALNGKQFVFVKNAIEIGANKAWLSVSNSNARMINLVFDETTGLSGELRVENGEFATAAWYDLNGRKLQGMPTKKGIYIMNGRKVVIR